MGLEKLIKCRKCDGLNAIDRSHGVTLGLGGLGYLSHVATQRALGVPKWQAAIIVIFLAALLDLSFLKIKKVGLIEALSGQKNP